MNKYIIIPIGTPGIGKTILGKMLINHFGDNSVNCAVQSFSGDDYGLDKFFEMLNADSINMEIMSESKEKKCYVTYIDRCHMLRRSRNEIMEIYNKHNKNVKYIFIDFINSNSKIKIEITALERIKNRPVEGQNLKYNALSNGFVVKKIIHKKMLEYEAPTYEEKYFKLINVNIWKHVDTIFKYVLSHIK